MAFSRADVRAELTTILKRHVAPDVAVSQASTIVGDLGLDSLAVMEVIADVEDRFHVTIPEDALPEIRTVGDVAAALERHLAAKGELS